MLPFSYAVRNLFRDRSRLALTVGGSALVVLLLIAATAFNQGMNAILTSSGDPRNVILLGSGSEESVERSELPFNAESATITSIPGLQQTLGGAAVSGEIVYQTPLRAAAGGDRPIVARGVTESALAVHTGVSLRQGRFPGPGEVMVGHLAHRKLGVAATALKPGAEVYFGDEALRVSGVFEAPGTVFESEVWFDRNDLASLTQRETLSTVALRLSEATFDDVEAFTFQRFDLEMAAIRETEYYAKLATFYRPIRLMTWVTALLVAAGAIFGGLNTLYAAFASRIREMATLQSIGYTRLALLFSIVQESLLATLTGTLLAFVTAYFLIDGLTVPFSLGTFTLTLGPAVIVVGLLTGTLLALLGTIPPAIRCLAPALPGALRSG